uniref:Protein FRA10AC1 n=1 Tax=Trichuris muris TaxID=70415 RepID=A0A5S6QHI9_TRIMR
MHDDLSSELDYNSEVERKRKRLDSFKKESLPPVPKPTKELFYEECAKENTKRQNVLHLDVYSRHKRLINQYFLTNPGSSSILQRDTSRDRTDIDLIRSNSKFLWHDDDEVDTWEKKLAKRYYEKLYKEYCIGDLSHYKENKVGLRWRMEQEVVEGKGQFVCGEKHCSSREDLASWECKFNYIEDGQKKTALVKLRLCPECSQKLNYKQRKHLAKSKQKEKSSERPTPHSASEDWDSSDDEDLIESMLL